MVSRVFVHPASESEYVFQNQQKNDARHTQYAADDGIEPGDGQTDVHPGPDKIKDKQKYKPKQGVKQKFKRPFDWFFQQFDQQGDESRRDAEQYDNCEDHFAVLRSFP